MREYRPEPVALAPTPWDRLGIPSGGSELLTQLHQGFSISTLQFLSEIILIDTRTLGQAISLSPSTLGRRARAGRFTTSESDSIYRLATVILSALDLFEGNVLSAKTWLQTPALALGGRKPLDMVSTQVETNAVLWLIGRVEHGVFS
ncbi:antitoxin Xre/MbcA/ParS toxin-binding domain-containing protein [Pseudomonas sp. LT1P18]|uniref:antitoxin Xre/MbcA/ParS toxin-binding domain-containing protein n=1 Tax=Pseudomonas arabinosi TaxID=3398357 RepID=UPI0039EE685C